MRLAVPFVWRRAERAGLRLRPAEDADTAFLRSVYASTRVEELAAVPWDDAQRAAFIEMQFGAQDSHYRRHYRDAVRAVIEWVGDPVGRLYLDRRSDVHHLIDIALLPGARGRGLGSALLGDLIEEADGAGRPVTVHVEKFNPAKRLYLRLGFRAVEDQGVYDLMRREPPD